MGGNVVSKHEKYKKRAEEAEGVAKMDHMKELYSNKGLGKKKERARAWVSKWDKDYECYYYEDTISGETTWDKPADFVEEVRVDDDVL